MKNHIAILLGISAAFFLGYIVALSAHLLSAQPMTSVWLSVGAMGIFGLVSAVIYAMITHRNTLRDSAIDTENESRAAAEAEDLDRERMAQEAKMRERETWQRSHKSVEERMAQAGRWTRSTESIREELRQREAIKVATLTRNIRLKHEEEERQRLIDETAIAQADFRNSESTFDNSESTDNTSLSSVSSFDSTPDDSSTFGGGGDFAGGGAGGEW
jgi:uncharacterized membrane protein YgcG